MAGVCRCCIVQRACTSQGPCRCVDYCYVSLLPAGRAESCPLPSTRQMCTGVSQVKGVIRELLACRVEESQLIMKCVGQVQLENVSSVFATAAAKHLCWPLCTQAAGPVKIHRSALHSVSAARILLKEHLLKVESPRLCCTNESGNGHSRLFSAFFAVTRIRMPERTAGIEAAR